MIPENLAHVRARVRRAFQVLAVLPGARGPALRGTYGVCLLTEPKRDRAHQVRFAPTGPDIAEMDQVLLSWLPLLRKKNTRMHDLVVQHAQGRSLVELAQKFGVSAQRAGQIERQGLQAIADRQLGAVATRVAA